MPLEVPPEPPIVSVVNTSNTTVQVSSAQVWSSAVQNVAISACLTALILAGKLSPELGSVLICAVAGIDLAGRKKLASSAGNAVAVGATGALSLLAKFPHIGVALIAGLTALGVM